MEREDVRTVDHKDFFGIAPGKVAGLKYFGIILVKEVLVNDKNEITEVIAELEQNKETKSKPKAYLNWISTKESVDCEVRLYEPLFSEYDPNKAEDFYKAINPNSKTVKRGCKMNKNLLGL